VKSVPFKIPKNVRERAISSGPVGVAWIDSLQDTLSTLASQWDLSIGKTFGRGTEAFVAAVSTAKCRRAVLKVVPPWADAAMSELTLLRLAAGRGYCEVYDWDQSSRAMLLERLGTAVGDLDLPTDIQLEIMCSTLAQAWMPPPPDSEFSTGAGRARDLGQFIETAWLELGRPCTETTIERVRGFVEFRSRAFDEKTAVLSHGDSHPWNALKVRGSEAARFKFIDPDGIVAEKAFDLGIQLREWIPGQNARSEHELLSDGTARCRRIASLSGVDAEAIWQWGLIGRTSAGLHFKKYGVPEAPEMLAVADAWASVDAPN
jgi:streptomycin 6-kinase